MAIDFSFLDAAAPQPQQAPQNDLANVKLRVDADAMLLCDGEDIDIELKAGVFKKTQLPVGQHLLEFLSEKNPDVKIEKVVDFHVAGNNYLVMVSGLQEALAQFESKAAAALGAKRVFKLVITGYENEMSAMMVVCNILGCSIAEARTKLAALPAVVIESEDKARVEALAGQFSQGYVSAVIETRNGYGELVDSDSYETQKEIEAKRKAEEEVKRKAEAKRKAEEEAKRKAAEAEAKRKAAEAEAKRKAAEAEAKRKAEEAKRKAEEEERKRKEPDVCILPEGVEEDDEEAVKWYRKAAEQGNADAMYKLGKCFYNGLGVEEDEEEAVKWFRKAADQGNADAMHKLGFCYLFGRGVKYDKEEAVKWYRKAAEQGNADAMYDLGDCYNCGWGVEEDEEEAVKWYRKAAEHGNLLALIRIQSLN